MSFTILDSNKLAAANIKVIGVGGGGGNAVNRMIISGVKSVSFISANTDSDALKKSLAVQKIQLGPKLTRGMGSGAHPEIGRQAAEESIPIIRQLLQGTDMLFITAGMGGGTGTGGAPVVAKVAKEMNILTIGVVTKPFMWEGEAKMTIAEEGIKKLGEYADAVIEIANQRLFDLIDKDTPAEKIFGLPDDVLKCAVQSISEIVIKTGAINVDFQDVKTILKSSGKAILGFSEASGDDRALQAIKKAVEHPLLNNQSIAGAKGVLVNITGGKDDLKMSEIGDVMGTIYKEASPTARIIYGHAFEDDLAGKIKITIIATGFTGIVEKVVDNSSQEEVNKEDLSIPAWMRKEKKSKRFWEG